MSKLKTNEQIQKHKDSVLEALSMFLDSLINSSDSKDAKRADLISYWLNDFQQYLSHEKNFDAARIKAYKRGDVIKVNLGFNVGSEQGGLRYAIVLDKDNKHNSKTITVVPLTSQKEQKKVYERDISLGKELYNRLKAKYDSTSEELEKKKSECNDMTANTQKALDFLLQVMTDTARHDDSMQQLVDKFTETLHKQEKYLSELENESGALKKLGTELHKMKDGSIAKIEQITTISKQRIYDPKKSMDVLDGIKFSDAAMDKINEKIKELYIF